MQISKAAVIAIRDSYALATGVQVLKVRAVGAEEVAHDHAHSVHEHCHSN